MVRKNYAASEPDAAYLFNSAANRAFDSAPNKRRIRIAPRTRYIAHNEESGVPLGDSPTCSGFTITGQCNESDAARQK
jgi:hypothetical protein